MGEKGELIQTGGGAPSRKVCTGQIWGMFNHHLDNSLEKGNLRREGKFKDALGRKYTSQKGFKGGIGKGFWISSLHLFPLGASPEAQAGGGQKLAWSGAVIEDEIREGRRECRKRVRRPEKEEEGIRVVGQVLYPIQPRGSPALKAVK